MEAARIQPSAQGLSPLARGNLRRLHPARSVPGPIPARAGEPMRRMRDAIRIGAYPRSRGGTEGGREEEERGRGLSPLARGNLVVPADAVGGAGPIPARAGEPSCRPAADLRPGAYPRSRGGTMRTKAVELFDQGLSPLARGNQPHVHPGGFYPGPIPARAGEPGPALPISSSRGAYPRSRGGTSSFGFYLEVAGGLSPRARGNRAYWYSYRVERGPIPARAGEPKKGCLAWAVGGAYPRSRGGTTKNSSTRPYW